MDKHSPLPWAVRPHLPDAHFEAAREYPQDVDITTGDVEDWADRIDAAAKGDREDAAKTALMAKCEICARLAPQGNAAAMRAALEDALCALIDIGCGRSVFKAIDKARAALSAPPRNCDRFATVDEAKAEWLRTNAKLLSSTGLMPFESWLFAPADGSRTRHVICMQCGRRGPDAKTPSEAIKAWNKDA